MTEYYKFLKTKIYIGILIVLGCATLGSVLGARKESKEPLTGVTREDIRLSAREDYRGPELTGILPLAAEQNKWYNFKYAAIFGFAGGFIFCGLMAVYRHYFYLRPFKIIREWIGADRDDLFLNLKE